MTARAVLLGALAFGCAEPSFVSLGRNLSEQSRLESDAGPALPDADGDMPFRVPDVPPPLCDGDGSIVVASDCASRELIECEAPNEVVPFPLSDLLATLLRACRADANLITVRFSEGCATSYDFAQPPFDASSEACVTARLAADRYSCAEQISCGVGETLGVPTSSAVPDWY